MPKIAIEKKVVVLPLIVYQKHWNSPTHLLKTYSRKLHDLSNSLGSLKWNRKSLLT